MSNVYSLYYGKSAKVLAEVIPDNEYAGMWRIRWPDRQLSDMVNLSRAKDAAMVLVRKNGIIDQSTKTLHWERTERPPGGPPVESTGQAGRAMAESSNTSP
jgi:hypothetical protein